MTEPAAPTPPVDPRATWDLPAFGELPPVEAVTPECTRVLAPNASPMTLDGTNTYVLGAAGRGVVAVVDPGPDVPAHREAVEAVVADRDAEVAAVLVTHHHVDHVEAAAPWARHFGCRVHAPRPRDAGADGVVLRDGDTVDLPGHAITTLATPGHTADHVAFRLPSGALLTGDHVLGRGTSVVAYPDGDLEAYLASLRRLLDLGPHALLPGHGPVLTEDPLAVLRYYHQHRDFRRDQVLAALAEGPATPGELVARIYAAVDQVLWPAAEASTRALLASLVDAGRIEHRADDVARRVD